MPWQALTPEEEADFARVAAWFRTAALPPSYRLGRHLTVVGPESHEVLRRLCDGARGQERRAALSRLRALEAKFGEAQE